MGSQHEALFDICCFTRAGNKDTEAAGRAPYFRVRLMHVVHHLTSRNDDGQELWDEQQDSMGKHVARNPDRAVFCDRKRTPRDHPIEVGEVVGISNRVGIDVSRHHIIGQGDDLGG